MAAARQLAGSCLLLLLAAACAQQLHRTEWATILTEQETSDVDEVATQASTVISALIRPRLSR